ncbi:metallophosphoesterase, partial [bacterium]|nr:metallophosphoesterase [bacterium]
MKKLFGLFLALMLFIPSVLAKDLRFVQITDVKYDASANNEKLKTAISEVNKQKDVEFIVFTGDNIARPTQKNMKGFISEAKKLKKPFYVVIGDRDVNKRKDFGKKEFTKYVHRHVRGYKAKTPNYIFEKGGGVFMVADGAKEVI